MKRIVITLSLVLLSAGLSTQSCVTTGLNSDRALQRIYVRYNDNVLDTLTTDIRYRVGVLEYVDECSCDATILRKELIHQ